MVKKLTDEELEWHENLSRDPKKNREYEKYVKEHAKRLRRLKRELDGVSVPGDYDE